MCTQNSLLGMRESSLRYSYKGRRVPPLSVNNICETALDVSLTLSVSEWSYSYVIYQKIITIHMNSAVICLWRTCHDQSISLKFVPLIPYDSLFTYTFFVRKPSFCLSFNFFNSSRNWAWDFLKSFLTFTEISWLKWPTFSLLILYTWIWIPSLTFWIQ